MVIGVLGWINLKFINILFLQKHIIALFLLYDIFLIIIGQKPCSGEEFYNNKKIFSWYSGLYYGKNIINLFTFIIISKIVFIAQIIISLDLIVIRIFFTSKIKKRKNGLYTVFVIIPGIHINLFLEKMKKIEIGKNDIKIIIMNFIFINLGMCGKVVINNAIILTESGREGKKHSFYPRIKFLKFLKLSQEYYFNKTNEMYSKYYTY